MKPDLTLEQLEEWFDDILKERLEEKYIIVTQGCKTYGWVERTNLNLNICLDPVCTSCSELTKILANENR